MALHFLSRLTKLRVVPHMEMEKNLEEVLTVMEKEPRYQWTRAKCIATMFFCTET